MDSHPSALAAVAEGTLFHSLKMSAQAIPVVPHIARRFAGRTMTVNTATLMDNGAHRHHRDRSSCGSTLPGRHSDACDGVLPSTTSDLSSSLALSSLSGVGSSIPLSIGSAVSLCVRLQSGTSDMQQQLHPSPMTQLCRPSRPASHPDRSEVNGGGCAGQHHGPSTELLLGTPWMQLLAEEPDESADEGEVEQPGGADSGGRNRQGPSGCLGDAGLAESCAASGLVAADPHGGHMLPLASAFRALTAAFPATATSVGGGDAAAGGDEVGLILDGVLQLGTGIVGAAAGGPRDWVSSGGSDRVAAAAPTYLDMMPTGLPAAEAAAAAGVEIAAALGADMAGGTVPASRCWSALREGPGSNRSPAGCSGAYEALPTLASGGAGGPDSRYGAVTGDHGLASFAASIAAAIAAAASPAKAAAAGAGAAGQDGTRVAFSAGERSIQRRHRACNTGYRSGAAPAAPVAPTIATLLGATATNSWSESRRCRGRAGPLRRVGNAGNARFNEWPQDAPGGRSMVGYHVGYAGGGANGQDGDGGADLIDDDDDDDIAIMTGCMEDGELGYCDDEVDDGGGVRSLCLGPNHRNHRARAQVLPWSVAAAAAARAVEPQSHPVEAAVSSHRNHACEHLGDGDDADSLFGEGDQPVQAHGPAQRLRLHRSTSKSSWAGASLLDLPTGWELALAVLDVAATCGSAAAAAPPPPLGVREVVLERRCSGLESAWRRLRAMVSSWARGVAGGCLGPKAREL